MQQVEAREWWLWGFAVTVTLVLTVGIVSLTFPGNHLLPHSEWLDLKEWVRGLACLVLLFDIYTIYQQLQLQRMRRELIQRNQLFEVITENAADMIAVIDGAGPSIHRLPYVKTDCTGSFEVTNNSLSRAVLRLERQGRSKETLETTIGAVLEMVGR